MRLNYVKMDEFAKTREMVFIFWDLQFLIWK